MIRLTLSLVLTATAGYFGFQQWTAHVLRHQSARQELTIEKALASGDPRSALPYLAKLPPLNAHATLEAKQQRLDLLVRGYSSARDFPKLLNLYRTNPAAILANSTASLLLARHFLALGQTRDVAALRTPWQSKPNGPAAWLLFDADVLLGQGQRDEAKALLSSTTLTGSDEAMRRVRLALLAAHGSDYTAAWNELAAAEKADTRNADVRAFRAQILDTAGKHALARVEYLAAVLAEPQNPLWVEQLADFYRRTGQLDLALDTLIEGEATCGLDTLAVKAAFWSRMLRSASVQTKANSATEARPNGSALASVAKYIRQHSQWSEAEARSLGDIDKLQATRPEILWLRVLAALQQGQEQQAFDLLQANHHKTNSLNPQLENALLSTLSWRLTQQLSPPSLKLASVPETTRKTKSSELTAAPPQHPFFRELAAARQAQHSQPGTAPTPALCHLLEGPHAFTSAFLAAGWRQAALNLQPTTPDFIWPTDTPLWLPYGLAQCLRANDSPETSLAFITQLPAAVAQAPELQLLVAENQLALGHTASAQAQLTTLASADHDSGYRAAWLLAGLYLEQHQPAEAERIVQQCPRLFQAPLGQELLATAALARHDEARAQQIYQTIAKDSIQARTYLARQAFTAKDYPTAERLTQELITLMPDKLQLRANLVAILDAKGDGSPGAVSDK